MHKEEDDPFSAGPVVDSRYGILDAGGRGGQSLKSQRTEAAGSRFQQVAAGEGEMEFVAGGHWSGRLRELLELMKPSRDTEIRWRP